MSALSDERGPTFVGVVTLVIGTLLAVAPERVGPAMALGDDPRVVRAVGVGDLVLVPGLLAGRPRWPWMVARAGYNVVLALLFRRQATHHDGGAPAHAGTAAMTGLTAIDLTVALALRRAGR